MATDDDTDMALGRDKALVEAYFRRGATLARELLQENERLRFRVAQLEEEVLYSKRSQPTGSTLKELAARIHVLETEREGMLSRFATVEAENEEFHERFVIVEEENNKLTNLYVAASQLHTASDLREVLRSMVEILLNFVGARVFAVYVIEPSGRIRPLVAEGRSPADLPFGQVGTKVPWAR